MQPMCWRVLWQLKRMNKVESSINMSTPVIEVSDLWYSIHGQSILENINLSVEEHAFLVLIGPNGGGKTTLLRLMLGLIRPDRGRIRIFGELPEKTMHRIGYVPQNVSSNLRFPITVKDVVLMGRIKTGWKWSRYDRQDRIAAETALRQVNMWEERYRRIDELSGGQRQRVYIARAVAGDPEILFLDEPTANIDPNGQGRFYEILKHLNQKITIVIVSHEFLVLSSYVKSVACVSGSLFHHNASEITQEMVDMYHCPVELIAHGIPHRVLKEHK